MPVVKIVGGHGRVALLIAQCLAKIPGMEVTSLFRNPEQAEAVKATGAIPVVFDVGSATVADFAEAFKGADFVIWSAGAGGKGAPSRTYAVDRDAAIRSMQASRQVGGVKRYIMVSYLGSKNAPQLDPSHLLFHYGQAKHAADEYLKGRSGLKYTIVSPGHLSDGPPSGRLDFTAKPQTAKDRTASRGNVAQLISDIVSDKTALEHTLDKDVEILDGNTPILEGLQHF